MSTTASRKGLKAKKPTQLQQVFEVIRDYPNHGRDYIFAIGSKVHGWKSITGVAGRIAELAAAGCIKASGEEMGNAGSMQTTYVALDLLRSVELPRAVIAQLEQTFSNDNVAVRAPAALPKQGQQENLDQLFKKTEPLSLYKLTEICHALPPGAKVTVADDDVTRWKQEVAANCYRPDRPLHVQLASSVFLQPGQFLVEVPNG